MKKKVYLVLKIVFLLLLIASLFGLFSWYNDKKVSEKIQEESKNLLEEVKTEEGIQYTVKKEAVSKNEDTVGWLKVNGTKIDYPVVQTKDNNYYLKHNYLKQKSSAGWIFMDSNNSLKDKNIIIYGHHRKDGIMFGDIDKLMKKKFYDNNDGKILLVINNENIYYQIFSVYKAKSNDDYANSNYDNFEEKLKEFKSKSKIKFDSNLDDVKQIITLSTCHDNNKDRLVVHAYRILS